MAGSLKWKQRKERAEHLSFNYQLSELGFVSGVGICEMSSTSQSSQSSHKSWFRQKAHAGELKVETKEGETAMFIIQLPLSQL